MYLYVKKHNKTGLKYLGKTTSKDPHKYTGSGKRWKAHLKKHGYDYSTDILLETNSKQELKEIGIYYSNLWDIVESSEWANLTIEEGTGGDTSSTLGYKNAIKNRNIRGNKNPMFGRSAVKEKNLKWYTNGEENIYVTEDTQPKGFYSGRSNLKRKPHSEETKNLMSRNRKGRVPPNRKKVISPQGVEYQSIAEAAMSLELTSSQFRHRFIKNGKWIIQE
jgi:hypothetical protein